MALAQNAERQAERRRVHANVAHALENTSSPGARALMERAVRQIDVWKSKRTCSPIYVKAWRRALRDPTRNILRLAEGRQGMEDAMLQNSPFGFAMRDPRFVGGQ
ncbi:MAG: hypothetical protein H0W24_10380 [Lysobacter sp.]|jgi:hypothetical protein|nr:hypothetical protein [Lysobacter sp.]